ncbi:MULTISPECIES: transposase [Sorangium]|uniref:transposase n=1 Tax=Sorangium TaxID=39643 RepID=UPI003D9C4430
MRLRRVWTRAARRTAMAPHAVATVTERARLRQAAMRLDGFTLHAATRAGAHHTAAREALLRYVLRPPIAQERVELQHDGLVRLSLKRALADGTVAVDIDPLSLLCRLATSRRSRPLPQPGAALLEEHRPAPQGAARASVSASPRDR